MDFPLHRKATGTFPWRTATLVAAAIAAVELVLLVVVGGALLAKPSTDPQPRPATKRTASESAAGGAKARATKAKASAGTTAARPATGGAVAELPRRKVEVLVLNGNGRTGAAAVAATRVGDRGYRVSGVANAPRQDYPQSIVLFRQGFAGEGRRLARDLGVRVVSPLDGMRPGQLHGAHVVLILGA